eukprot:CAMPEP_0181449898 /NCGR_PEP_ID=MMETSP1110-20121109/27899_1 /TAXON_ID=174948 /ORGANISM="Symbiodinium sp., Strain CCMP421" /LENGTH=87 /DNA_ID=CAMNT_0023574105 /DNA_START=461 /DNA_END=724 /DNA_ORIENTATION=+
MDSVQDPVAFIQCSPQSKWKYCLQPPFPQQRITALPKFKSSQQMGQTTVSSTHTCCQISSLDILEICMRCLQTKEMSAAIFPACCSV